MSSLLGGELGDLSLIRKAPNKSTQKFSFFGVVMGFVFHSIPTYMGPIPMMWRCPFMSPHFLMKKREWLVNKYYHVMCNCRHLTIWTFICINSLIILQKYKENNLIKTRGEDMIVWQTGNTSSKDCGIVKLLIQTCRKTSNYNIRVLIQRPIPTRTWVITSMFQTESGIWGQRPMEIYYSNWKWWEEEKSSPLWGKNEYSYYSHSFFFSNRTKSVTWTTIMVILG